MGEPAGILDIGILGALEPRTWAAAVERFEVVGYPMSLGIDGIILVRYDAGMEMMKIGA